jgi:hypothetical protein
MRKFDADDILEYRLRRAGGPPRSIQRHPAKFPVSFSWKDATGERRSSKGVTRDISAKGMFVRTGTVPPASVVVRCRLELPALDTRAPDVVHEAIAVGRVIRSDRDLPPSERGFALRTRAFVVRHEE